MSEEEPIAIKYSSKDLIEQLENCSESKFDKRLGEAWDKAMRDGLFRYTLSDIPSRVSSGPTVFLMQLNPARGQKRRRAASMTDMQMPFDPNGFHFNKIKPEEVLGKLQPEDSYAPGDHLVVINVSPLEFGHVLLVPRARACLPQRLDLPAVRLGLDLLLLSTNGALRIVFNSLLALASVNHQHLHAWYLNYTLPVQTLKVSHVYGVIYRTVDYFAHGFCLQLHGSTIEEFSRDVNTVVTCLQGNNIAHNVFITRAARFNEPSSFPLATVRAYIWPRRSETGSKDTVSKAFNLAGAELAGQVPVYDEAAFHSLNGEDILNSMKDSLFTEIEFSEIVNLVKRTFKS